MKKRTAHVLRRIAHRLAPEWLESVTVSHHAPQGWRHTGEPVPIAELVTHVDIRCRGGKRVVGYVDGREHGSFVKPWVLDAE